MMNRHATAEDFTRWSERAATLSIDQLEWTIRDAFAASAAVDSHAPEHAGFWRDQALTYQTELNARRAGKAGS